MQKKWLVVYTKPRHEKKSVRVLESNKIDVYLPLQKKLKEWSDRKKWIEEPLFSGYLFVKITEKEYMQVLNTPGIVKFISFNHQPAVVNESIIKSIKILTQQKFDNNIEVSEETWSINDEVLIKKGPLKGVKGKLIDFKSKTKLAIEIECMQKTVLVEINKSYLN